MLCVIHESSKRRHNKSDNSKNGNKNQEKIVEKCKKTVPRPVKPYIFLLKNYMINCTSCLNQWELSLIEQCDMIPMGIKIVKKKEIYKKFEKL